MSKIIAKIKSQVQESTDSQTLNAMFPYATVYDMLHQFTKNATYSRAQNLSVLCETVKKHTKMSFEYEDYNNYSKKEKIISHTELYKPLFNIYTQYIQYSINNPFLPQKQTQPSMFFADYEKLPKRYRGIFQISSSNDYYPLRTNRPPMIIKHKKSEGKNFIALLTRASMLLPVLENNTKSTFNEKVKTIKLLHDIFVNLAKITYIHHIEEKKLQPSGSCIIWEEYQNELTHKNMILHAHEYTKTLKQHEKEELNQKEQEYNFNVQYITNGYKKIYSEILQQLKSQSHIK